MAAVPQGVVGRQRALLCEILSILSADNRDYANVVFAIQVSRAT